MSWLNDVFDRILHGGGLVTTPQGVLNWTGKTIGETVSSTVSPLLLPILLIVFVFAIGGGKVF